MDINSVKSLRNRSPADLIVVPFWKGKKHAEAAFNVESLTSQFHGPISTHDFKGNAEEIAMVYLTGEPEKRLVLLGLESPEGLTVEKLRKAYAKVTKLCLKHNFTSINILIPEGIMISRSDCITGVMEGLLLPNYLFLQNKLDSIKKNRPTAISEISLIDVSKEELIKAQRIAHVSDAVNFARDLVNGNADDVTPQHLVAVARGLEKTCNHVKTTVFDKKQIEKLNMGLLLAVNRSSVRDPAFMVVEYKGNPKSKDLTVLVGKGITFDTGGLNLKPTGSMETMRDDMAGAATVLGVILAASALELKVNVTAVVTSTENTIGSDSYKPGDVYSGYSGKTVEIGNTDAEGRLVLADALGYVVDKIKPSRIIDFATLTGAMVIALGSEASGFFSNDDSLADELENASLESGERIWRLPLYEEYRDSLKSDIADIKSTGGRDAGACKAAAFLEEFVGKTPWAHLDIAGTAFLTEQKSHLPKYASGVGIRLLIAFLSQK